MKIEFESQFHKDLYKKCSASNRNKMVATWGEFLSKYPEYSRYNVQWLKSRNAESSPLSLQIPWVTYPSIDWLSAVIERKHIVFEWGMGGSTVFLAKKCKKVISVEHNEEWFTIANDVINNNLIGSFWASTKRKLLSQTSPELFLVPGECQNSDSVPKIRSGLDSFDNIDFASYVNHINQYPLNYFDFILIDGRARMDCFQKAIPHCRGGGYIILDNSDYLRYQGRLLALEADELKGWEKECFLGPGPSSSYIGWRTTVYKKPYNKG